MISFCVALSAFGKAYEPDVNLNPHQDNSARKDPKTSLRVFEEMQLDPGGANFCNTIHCSGESKGGVRDVGPPPPSALGIQNLSISCIFWENLAKVRPPGGKSWICHCIVMIHNGTI